MLYNILKYSALLISRIIFQLKVSGKKNIPRKGAFILASNHASYLDPVVLAAACPRKLNFMARHDLFDIPVFSWVISHVDSFPVKRESPDPSAFKEAMRRLKAGKGLLVFPEGGRQVDGKLGEPEPGIGFLSVKLGVPVIPAFIKGTEKALPKGAKFIRPKKVAVYFGKQILVERRLSYQDIARIIMEDIRLLSCSVAN